MNKKVCLFIIVTVLLAGCTRSVRKEQRPLHEKAAESSEIIAENLVGDGVDFYQAEKYNEAAQRWKAALRLIPDDAEVQNFLGLAYHRMGKLDSAIIYFSEAAKIDTSYSQAWNNLGYMYFLKSEYSKALPFFKRALQADPAYDQARLNYSKTREIMAGKLPFTAFELVERTSKIDSLEYQIHNYRKALQLDPNYVDAWNNLGVAYYYYGMTDSAVYCLKKALTLNPDYPPAHNNAGYILDAAGNFDEAISHYQAAIMQRPLYIVAMTNLLDTYMHKQDYDSAMKILNALKEIAPQNQLVELRIKEYQELLYGGGK
ncbi:MAG: tetratricopeptide repeat protein [Calditrichia bacterium]